MDNRTNNPNIDPNTPEESEQQQQKKRERKMLKIYSVFNRIPQQYATKISNVETKQIYFHIAFLSFVQEFMKINCQLKKN